MTLKVVLKIELKGSCSIVSKPLCYHTSDPRSISRGGHTSRSPYILNEYGIIPGLTPGHRR